MDLGLKGKTVFISASVQGIGYATADAFMAEGASVILNGRNETRLREAAETLERKHDRRVQTFLGDMRQLEDIKSLTEYLDSGLDVFIANLGCGKPESKNSLNIEEWKRFFDINVASTVMLLNSLHPILRKGKEPAVVLISSVISKEAASAPIGYAAAKSAVRTLNKYLSREWASDGIRVNCVLPGNILFQGGRWEELRRQDEKAVDEYIKASVPMKRFGKPEEVADAIVFLACSRSKFTTGSELAVDGGQLGAI